MRIADEAKRRRIIRTAAKLFATTPFHEVTLSDVARAAKIGKGTIYVYFKSKEDLYLALLYEGFGRLVEQLRAAHNARGARPSKQLRQVVEAVVRFSFEHPHFYELTRRVGVPAVNPTLDRYRTGLFDLVESIIREGNKTGEFADPHPALTARFVPGFIRLAMLHPPAKLSPASLTRHIMRIITQGISAALPIDA